MAFDSKKGHAALRRGRISVSRSQYFLTICTAGRRRNLATESVGGFILDEARAMEREGTWVLRCAVVMPDHIHLLVELGERLPLARTVQRLKAKTASRLREADLRWERGFFDHQIRPDDDSLSLFLYIHLNPYRGSLCLRSDQWEWFFCRPEDWTWFQTYLDADRPLPEWLS